MELPLSTHRIATHHPPDDSHGREDQIKDIVILIKNETEVS